MAYRHRERKAMKNLKTKCDEQKRKKKKKKTKKKKGRLLGSKLKEAKEGEKSLSRAETRKNCQRKKGKNKERKGEPCENTDRHPGEGIGIGLVGGMGRCIVDRRATRKKGKIVTSTEKARRGKR